mgnify:CR=1 FL=1
MLSVYDGTINKLYYDINITNYTWTNIGYRTDRGWHTRTDIITSPVLYNPYLIDMTFVVNSGYLVIILITDETGEVVYQVYPDGAWHSEA